MTLLAQVGEMARRSITQTLRQPALLVPPILFPLLPAGGQRRRARRGDEAPGLPDRQLPQLRDRDPVHAGRAVRVDQRRARAWRATSRPGFLKRLALTPMQRAALLLGNLAGVMTVAALASLVYLVVGLAAGLHLDAGVGGGLVLIVLAFLVALAFASLGALVGLRAGSGEAVQGLFPRVLRLPLPVLAGAAAAADRAGLVPHDRDWNPVSYMLEGIRSVVITGWDRVALERGFAIAIVLCAIGILGASRALRTRLVRT